MVPAVQAAQVGGVQPSGFHREVETVRRGVSRWRSARRAEVGRRVPRHRLSHRGGVQGRPHRDHAHRGQHGSFAVCRRARQRARRCASRQGCDRAGGQGRARRWRPTIVAASRITHSASRTTACFRPRNCRPHSKTPRAPVRRSSTKERARLHVRAAEQATIQQKDVLKSGGKADKALTVAIVRVNEIADQQGARARERRCAARLAHGVFPRGAPDAAAARAHAARTLDGDR